MKDQNIIYGVIAVGVVLVGYYLYTQSKSSSAAGAGGVAFGGLLPTNLNNAVPGSPAGTAGANAGEGLVNILIGFGTGIDNGIANAFGYPSINNPSGN